MLLYLFFFISIALAIGYVFLIMRYLEGWTNTDVPTTSDSKPVTSVSIIVAVYNEEQNIEACVTSILRNVYPETLLELIVVDNGSTDNTYSILTSIKDSRLLVLQQKEGHKKEALEKGIQYAKNEFLLFTDGDCEVRERWVERMIFAYEKNGKECVLGPVDIDKYNSVLTRFQAFDMLAMMGITCGGLKENIMYLSNGANFGYTRALYDQIKGIPKKNLASGDDVFVLHEIVKKGKEKIAFVKSKEAIVSTHTQTSWKSLIQQRIRWASKATSYVQKRDVFINGYVFLFSFSILVNLVLSPLTGGLSFFTACFQFFIKGAIDYAFIDHVNKFFKKKHLMQFFISSFFIHWLYILFAGITSLLGLSYDWRGKKLHVI